MTLTRNRNHVKSYTVAVEAGEVKSQGGYHQPGKNFTGAHCGCELETGKGAYRDTTVEMPDGTVIHFYHQSPVVVETPDGKVYADNCGYKTNSTKDRIRGYLPKGYNIIQEDYEWYVTTPDGERVPFENGMEITEL